MAKVQVMLFISLLVFAFVQTGSSLYCYNCTQVTDSKCKDYFTKEVKKIECPPGYLCTKHTQPAITTSEHEHGKNLTKNVIRSCKPLNYCLNVHEFSQFCESCSENYCNVSPIVIPSILTIVFGCIIAQKY